ncbi:phosphoribosylaminoimidazolesuccinocarboxamide synthase [Candidatus Woesearchaeota archaeon]|nr:phosphoribosylaminoimidazolesuccinocarboxamide synthase [Candidatus Woesearchaeota archaeon]
MTTPSPVIRQKVAAHLDDVVLNPSISSLGISGHGKVREKYLVSTKEYDQIVVMIASDRVSAFDVILDRAIPFKGIVLNAITEHSFQEVSDLVDIALLPSPHPRIVIQRALQNIGIECVMRGYIWGNLAKEYEHGSRVKCGVELPNGLLHYQRLDSPLFTPTTKAEQGHDQDLDIKQLPEYFQSHFASKKINFPEDDFSSQVKELCSLLYQRGAVISEQKGLFLLDTKYELGVDQHGKLYLIDEVHTPDSSRYVAKSEWQTKMPQIEEKIQSGQHNTVSELLNVYPELKMRELSKQVVRDVLLENGYDDKKGIIPSLTDVQIIETSARYIELYEQLLGKDFDFTTFSQPFQEELILDYVKNL